MRSLAACRGCWVVWFRLCGGPYRLLSAHYAGRLDGSQPSVHRIPGTSARTASAVLGRASLACIQVIEPDTASQVFLVATHGYLPALHWCGSDPRRHRL